MQNKAIESRLFFCLDDHRPNKQQPGTRRYLTQIDCKMQTFSKESSFFWANDVIDSAAFSVGWAETKRQNSWKTTGHFPKKQTQRKINNFQIRIKFWYKIKPWILGYFFVWTITDQTNKQPWIPVPFHIKSTAKSKHFQKSVLSFGQMMPSVRLFSRLDDQKPNDKTVVLDRDIFPKNKLKEKKGNKQEQNKNSEQSSSDPFSQHKSTLRFPKTNEQFPNQNQILMQNEALESRLFFRLDDNRPNKQTARSDEYFTSNRLQKAKIFKSGFFLWANDVVHSAVLSFGWS